MAGTIEGPGGVCIDAAPGVAPDVTGMSRSADCGNVWAVFYRAFRGAGDVAVPAARADDPREWERAHYNALQNMLEAQRQAERWAKIADELGAGKAAAEQTRAAAQTKLRGR